MLDSAIALVTHHGIAELTLGRLAEAAGVNDTAVRNAFGSRYALIDAAIASETRRWANAAPAMPADGSVAGLLDAHWDAFLAPSQRRRMLLLLYRKHPESDESADAALSRCRHAVWTYTADRIARLNDPRLHRGDASHAEATSFILAAIVGLLLHAELDPETDVRADYWQLRCLIDARWPPRAEAPGPADGTSTHGAG